MSGGYRITVRGIMSDRFCQALGGIGRRVDVDRTVLESVGPVAPPMEDVLTTLGNLGLEILAIESPHGTTAHTTLEA